MDVVVSQAVLRDPAGGWEGQLVNILYLCGHILLSISNLFIFTKDRKRGGAELGSEKDESDC